METVWEYSPKTEALRLLHNSHQIATGFFKTNRFVVLPVGHPARGDQIAYTPDLPYLSIPRYWEKASRINIKNLPLQAPAELVAAAVRLHDFSHIAALDYSPLKKLWSAYESQIMAAIYKLIPGKKDAIKSLTIYPTVISTGCSFNAPSRFPADIYIWLRQDKGVASIVEAILSALTRNDVYTRLDGLWQESK